MILVAEQIMSCPQCASSATSERAKKTELGYHTFHCSTGKPSFNQRTGTPFNCLEYPTDIVRLVVLWRLRYKRSLRDLAQMFLERGFAFTHEAVREGRCVSCRCCSRSCLANRRARPGEPGTSMKPTAS